MSRMYPERPFVSSSIAVFREGRALLARRASGAGAGLFSLPGGMVETGELLAEAALRELAEETGVVARVLGFVGHQEVILKDAAGAVSYHFVVAVHAGAWISGEGVPSAEASEFIWVDPHHPGALPMTDGLAAMLRAAAHVAGV